MNPENALPKGPQIVSLADEEGVKQILVRTIFGLWEIVNDLTRLRPSQRERYRVTIFGSAQAQPGTYVYDEAKRWLDKLVASQPKEGFDILPEEMEIRILSHEAQSFILRNSP